MSPLTADVIFPAFTTPYFSPLLFPIAGIAAIGTEWFCYRRFSTDRQYPKFGDIVLADLVSWFAGIVITFFLPSGLVEKAVPGAGGHGTMTTGPHFTVYAIAGFFLACVLSIIIEFWSLRISMDKRPVARLFRLSAIANTAGYIVLGLVVWIWVT